ncbi:NADH:flavin oxidoreductase [Nocardioides sp.]|uniref:NADH:flavin oxidoreductase n=1 Tax=Nocardioides sp. TaxID=35761 RepID=UPI003517BDF3
MTVATPALNAPLALAHGPAWANRIALAPLTNTQSHPDGSLSDDEHRWLAARAAGGFALTMTCAAFVNQDGKAWQGQLGLHADADLGRLRRLTDEIRAHGSVSAVQLHHAGLRADPATSQGGERVAPWDDAAKGARALTTAEVRQVVDDFVAAAVRAEQAGFDGVEIHGAHGYLLAQFLDGRKNHRTDGYGGAFADRARIVHEVVDGIRAAVGPDLQVGIRLTAERYGITLPEFLELAGDLMAGGKLDYLDASLWDVRKEPADPAFAGTRLIDHITAVPRHGTALGVAGEVQSAADVAWCLEQGADFVLVGTGAILHHDFAARSLADPAFVVRPRPVPREVLEAESVGAAFIDYLAAGWDEFVA